MLIRLKTVFCSIRLSNFKIPLQILLYMCALVRKHEKAAFKEISIYLNMIVERHLALIKVLICLSDSPLDGELQPSEH